MLNTTVAQDAVLLALYTNPRGIRRCGDTTVLNVLAQLSRRGLVTRSLPTGYYHLTDRAVVAKHLRRIGCALTPVAVESRRAA